MQTILQGIIDLIQPVLFASGLLFAYTGYTMYRLYLWLIGFALGFVIIAVVVASWIIGSANNIFQQMLLMRGIYGSGPEGWILPVLIIVGVVGGLFGAGVMILLEKVIVASIGFGITWVVASAFVSGDMAAFLAILFGVAGAVLTWVVYVWAIILVTAGFGAGLVTFVEGGDMVMVLSIFLSGVIVQNLLLMKFGFSEDIGGVEDPTDDATESSNSSTVSAEPRISNRSCFECGAANRGSDRYCQQCNAKL